jgi:hypothetical protein
MNADEIVVGEVECESGFHVLPLLTETDGQTGKPSLKGVRFVTLKRGLRLAFSRDPFLGVKNAKFIDTKEHGKVG